MNPLARAGTALGCAVLGWTLAGAALASGVQVKVQGPDGLPLSGAVVFLDSPQAASVVQPMAAAEMAQEKKAFVPGVLVVTKGTSVAFPNRDTVRHHVYSFSAAKTFELKLYNGTPSNPVVFDRVGVAVLGCNIHDQMVGWVLVLQTPYHATTSDSGEVTLTNVPPGSYTLRTWHSRLPLGADAVAQPLRLGAEGATVSVRLSGLQP